MRLFLGLAVNATAQRQLAALQSELRELALSGLRLTTPENLHATLKFLGSVAADDVAPLTQVLRDLPGKITTRARVVLRGVDAFPTQRRPRAVFAAVGEGRTWLVELMGAVEAACVSLGYPAEERPRVPHVTLARVDHPRAGRALREWFAKPHDAPQGEIDTSTLILFQSEPTPQGSRYTVVTRIPLT